MLPEEVVKLLFFFSFKELRGVIKNIIAFHMCIAVLERCTRRNVMDCPGDPLEFPTIVGTEVRP